MGRPTGVSTLLTGAIWRLIRGRDGLPARLGEPELPGILRSTLDFRSSMRTQISCNFRLRHVELRTMTGLPLLGVVSRAGSVSVSSSLHVNLTRGSKGHRGSWERMVSVCAFLTYNQYGIRSEYEWHQRSKLMWHWSHLRESFWLTVYSQ